MPVDAPSPTTPSRSGTEGLAHARALIAAAAHRAGRAPEGVRLLAVSKGQDWTRIAALAAAGQRDFGENYLQEALPKIRALATHDLTWHFIGRLQANKTREVAAHFAWVQSIDRLRIAERLSAQRPDTLPPLQCLVEINADRELSKGGVDGVAVSELVAAIHALPGLHLRGFMTMPAPRSDPVEQRAVFRRVREALAPWMSGCDTLSMGTSGDFEAAIAEGSTLVRLGTAVFGPRPPRASG